MYQRRNAAGAAWEDVTNLARGERGPVSFAQVTQANVDPLIAAYDGAIPNLDIPADQVPDLPASKVASGALDPDRIPGLDGSKITSGEVGDTFIPSVVDRTYNDVPASRVNGELADGNIPGNVARDADVTASIDTNVKEFARAGQRGVRVGDMDSEGAPANQVPASQGPSGAVTWGDQRGPQPPAHTSYLGLGDDAAFTATEFTVSGQGGLVVPAIGAGETRHIAYARPASLGNFTFVYMYPTGARDTQNRISAWTQQADLVVLGGIPQVVLYSNAAQSPDASGMVIEAG